MNTLRTRRVAVTSADGVMHSVEVTGTSVFEVAAVGIAQMRDAGWVEPLAPEAVVRVEVQLAPVVHEVPLRAMQRWANGPSISPKEDVLKRPLRNSGRCSAGGLDAGRQL